MVLIIVAEYGYCRDRAAATLAVLAKDPEVKVYLSRHALRPLTKMLLDSDDRWEKRDAATALLKLQYSQGHVDQPSQGYTEEELEARTDLVHMQLHAHELLDRIMGRDLDIIEAAAVVVGEGEAAGEDAADGGDGAGAAVGGVGLGAGVAAAAAGLAAGVVAGAMAVAGPAAGADGLGVDVAGGAVLAGGAVAADAAAGGRLDVEGEAGQPAGGDGAAAPAAPYPGQQLLMGDVNFAFPHLPGHLLQAPPQQQEPAQEDQPQQRQPMYQRGQVARFPRGQGREQADQAEQEAGPGEGLPPHETQLGEQRGAQAGPGGGLPPHDTQLGEQGGAQAGRTPQEERHAAACGGKGPALVPGGGGEPTARAEEGWGSGGEASPYKGLSDACVGAGADPSAVLGGGVRPGADTVAEIVADQPQAVQLQVGNTEQEGRVEDVGRDRANAIAWAGRGNGPVGAPVPAVPPQQDPVPAMDPQMLQGPETTDP
eukprot:gene16537-22765_t